MKNKRIPLVFKLLSALIFGSMLAQLTPAYAGGSSGGGPGTAVINSDQTATLLPIYLANPNFRDSFVSGIVELPEPFTACEHNPLFTLVLPYVACNPVKAVTLIGQLLLKKIESWRCSSPTLMQAIHQGLLWSNFYFTKDKAAPDTEPLDDGYYLPAPDQKIQLKTAAYYDRDTFVRVNTEVYNLLGDHSRAALFLWESLREVILANGGNISLEQQQNLVAKIILSLPIEGETLETSEFMSGALLDLAKENHLNKNSEKCTPARPFPIDFRQKLIIKRSHDLTKFFNR
ncbi:MAG: hypothetical protein SGJ18_08420 [Pseudomonadota bacterium]|nr:hypothetical protein [Pseudomonadota bacterium]